MAVYRALTKLMITPFHQQPHTRTQERGEMLRRGLTPPIIEVAQVVASVQTPHVVLVDVANVGHTMFADLPVGSFRPEATDSRGICSMISFVESGVRSSYSNWKVESGLLKSLQSKGLLVDIDIATGQDAADGAVMIFCALAWRSPCITTCKVLTDDVKMINAIKRLYPKEFVGHISTLQLRRSWEWQTLFTFDVVECNELMSTLLSQ